MLKSYGIFIALLTLSGLQFITLCRGFLSSTRSILSHTSGRANFIKIPDIFDSIRAESRSELRMSTSPQQFNRCSRPSAPPPPINQYIRADKVRLIVPGNDTEEVMLGIFSLSDALLEAEKFNLDLVMINDKGDPPVCKVIDYGKYKYSLEKKKKENLKKQVNVDIKEVKMSYKIDQHDFDVRMRAVRKFLGEGDKVHHISLIKYIRIL